MPEIESGTQSSGAGKDQATRCYRDGPSSSLLSGGQGGRPTCEGPMDHPSADGRVRIGYFLKTVRWDKTISVFHCGTLCCDILDGPCGDVNYC